MSKYTDIMIDIETIGDRMDSVILSISAVLFNMNGDISERVFDKYIDIDSSIRAGAKVTCHTFLWWLGQSEDARQTQISATRFDLAEVLAAFTRWYNEHCLYNNTELNVWGNGSKFDLGIITSAYESLGLKVPWKPWVEHDVRTVVRFNPEIKKAMKQDFQGVEHKGIDDCKHQIRYLIEILKSRNLI